MLNMYSWSLDAAAEVQGHNLEELQRVAWNEVFSWLLRASVALCVDTLNPQPLNPKSLKPQTLNRPVSSSSASPPARFSFQLEACRAQHLPSVANKAIGEPVRTQACGYTESEPDSPQEILKNLADLGSETPIRSSEQRHRGYGPIGT